MDKSVTSTKKEPLIQIECLNAALSSNDLHDLCDATDAAIESGGGFGWLSLPARDIMERYWGGVIALPLRILLVARLDGVICGTCQLIRPVPQNEAQSHAVQLTTHFISPWARGYGLARKLLAEAERVTKEEGYSVINLDLRATQIAAISLYESHGYTRYGEHPHYAIIDGEVISGFHYTKLVNADLLS